MIFVNFDLYSSNILPSKDDLISLTLVMLTVLRTTLLLNFNPVKLKHSSCKHLFSIRVENRVDPDQVASLEAS